MTDITALATRQYERIQWQSVPEDVTLEDLTLFIADAIKYLYIVTGRGLQFNDDMLIKEDNLYKEFTGNLYLDEEEYVIITAELQFSRKVQASVSDLVSYTTDAMSVTHGDKPFANLQQKIDDLQSERRVIWYKMIRYHLL